MRLFRTLFSFMIVAAIGISMITTCTTKTDFAKYYVSQSESKLGGFFDGALEKVVTQQTKASNYLIFSVFEMDGERYLGTFLWKSIDRAGGEDPGRAAGESRRGGEKRSRKFRD